MLTRKNFYKKHPERCHVYEEAGKRGNLAKSRIDHIFRIIGMSSKNRSEEYFGFVLLHTKFDKALFCYGMQLETYCLIELYSVLESSLIIRLREEFGKISISRKLNKFLKGKIHLFELEYFLRRIKASEIANIFKKMNIITKDNYKFLIDLENLRDALVHRNLAQIEKFNIKSHKVHLHTTDTYLVRFNIENYFMKAVQFEWNLLSRKQKIRFIKDSEILN